MITLVKFWYHLFFSVKKILFTCALHKYHYHIIGTSHKEIRDFDMDFEMKIKQNRKQKNFEY